MIDHMKKETSTMKIPTHLFGIPVVFDNLAAEKAFYVRLPSLVFVVATESPWPRPKGSWDITIRTNTEKMASTTVEYRPVEGVPDEVVLRSWIEEAVRKALTARRTEIQDLEKSLFSESPWGTPKEAVILGITAVPSGTKLLQGKKGRWMLRILPERQYEDTYNPTKNWWSYVKVELQHSLTGEGFTAFGDLADITSIEKSLCEQVQHLAKVSTETVKDAQGLVQRKKKTK